MKLYIARHGETDMNAANIPQGWIDTALNENGIQQAIEMARSFYKPIEAIFTSDLQRSARTAQEFQKYFEDLPYFEDDRLRVRDFGDAAGVDRGTYDLERFWEVYDEQTIPHSEILSDFTQRIEEFLTELKSKPYELVLIVTHGNVMNQIQTILDPTFENRPRENSEILEITL